MPDTTPAPSDFQDAYAAGRPPWVIDEPQPAVVELERRGGIGGSVLDIGCGTGEHTILLAARGHDVLGVDAAPAAIEQARRAADERGVPARFAVGDALHLDDVASEATGRVIDPVDVVLDSALFHIFAPADRAAYAAALARAVRPGGLLVVLALADTEPGFGPRVPEDAIPGAFTAPDWALEEQQRSTYRGRIPDEDSARLHGRPVGGTVDLPAWLATVRRR